ncbi:MAG: dihydrofolate reductase family protein [Solirubrobacterales bacterium]
MRPDRPCVVVHVAVSVDGATAGFEPDAELFYALASTWGEDVTLAGADTILAQEEVLADAPRPGPAADGPLLAVVDGRRRVSQWEALRECGHWSDVCALRAGTVNGRVDLVAALGALRERGAQVVRVDSGGGLNGALLRARLVDELSLLVHPCVAGSGRRWWGSSPPESDSLRRLACEPVGVGLVWLRYETREGG